MSWNKAGVEGAGRGAQAIEKCKHVFPVACRVRWGGDRSGLERLVGDSVETVYESQEF